ncbi:DUF4410 domain-containing protein [Beijerinckia mobilis]|uniref:DUF4410 domain-containing protein n=1 Tax=Beijerinckia mobilis TaxID=231434 RepID=UPI000556100D|nr:DUF4410 domain-containing protein [Beijerinckia mobilis]
MTVRNKSPQGLFKKRIWFLLTIILGARQILAVDVKAGEFPADTRSQAIYVSDFSIGNHSLRSESRLSGLLVHDVLEQEKANSLPSLMSRTIARDLNNKGGRAYRLSEGSPMPTNGILISGALVEIDEGNRIQRSIIGFGAGRTHIQVKVTVKDLSSGKVLSPIHTICRSSSSNKSPGAIVMPSPHVAAAKFLLAGHDLDRNIKHCAAIITNEVLANLDLEISDKNYRDITFHSKSLIQSMIEHL